MATIVLVHGWGFDHGVWDAVRSRLGAAHRVETVDFGFFGAPRQPSLDAGEAVIAVGHSLGACWWLTQATPPWRRLLAINGFPRFTEGDGFSPAVAPRTLARMRKNFGREPAAVLGEFRTFCGAPQEIPLGGAPQEVRPQGVHSLAAAPPAPLGFDAVRLAAGLDWLAAWDGRGVMARRSNDIWALAGANDPIVPLGMSRAAFATLPDGHLAVADVAGHVLPLAAPDLCADWIERLAAA